MPEMIVFPSYMVDLGIAPASITVQSVFDAFRVGYLDSIGANPWYPSSDFGDAWLLGRRFAEQGRAMPTAVKKSRGYTFKIDGELVKV